MKKWICPFLEKKSRAPNLKDEGVESLLQTQERSN